MHLFLLNEKQTDYFLAGIVGTVARFQKIDFPASWLYSPYSTIIPYPKDMPNITAATKPFARNVQDFFKIFMLISDFE